MEISKMVVDREKSAAKVIAAAREHQEKAGAGMEELLGGHHRVAAEKLMRAAAEALEEKTREMVAADEANILEMGDDAAPRAARDESTEELRSVFVELRQVATTIYGTDYVSRLGYEGETPTDPVLVRRLGERLLGRLDEVERPQPRFAGMSFDPLPWKTKIADPLTTLSNALTTVESEARQFEASLSAKTRAIESYDDAFTKTAGLVSALLRVAGETELADRVRPIKSRPGRISDPETPIVTADNLP